MSNQDQRYIRIARACLKAINQTSASDKDKEKDIQNVYQAIDNAFRQEFSNIQRLQLIAETALTDITDLGKDANLASARKLANETLDEIASLQGKGVQH